MGFEKRFISLQGFVLYPHNIFSAKMRKSFVWWNYRYIIELVLFSKQKRMKVKYRTFKEMDVDRKVLEQEGVHVRDHVFWL